MTEYYPNYTSVCYYLQATVHPKDECKGAKDDYTHECSQAGCPTNPRLILTKTDVSIPGYHITTKPIDSSYNVRIYQKTELQSDINLDSLRDFQDFELITEFNIAYTEDFHDTKILYGDVLNKYLTYLSRINYNHSSFHAMVPVESYAKAFGALVQKIVESTVDAGGGEKKDCPHVKKRTKRK